jgi:HSP20 family protein
MFVTHRFSFDPFRELRGALEHAFNDVARVTGLPALTRAESFPALNVWERDEKLFVEAELPGLTLDDIDLTVTGRELTLKGRRKAAGDEKIAFHRRERGTGEFSRFVTLPFDVEADAVEALLRDGVLTIVLPKAERSRTRKIEVKTSA